MNSSTALRSLAQVLTIGIVASLASVTLAQGLTARQTTLMVNNCVQCHTKPILGAPLIGDQKAWKEVLKKGEDTVLRNVVQGFGSMPPLGYCSTCDEADFRALIQAMSGLTNTATP